MKKTRLVITKADSNGPTSETAPWLEEGNLLPGETLNLSPRRIVEGETTTTAVLYEILEHKEPAHQTPYWD